MSIIYNDFNEMDAISNIMIANNHYTIHGLRELVDSYNNPKLSHALDCVLEEGSIQNIITFFLDNTDVYEEALLQNTGMDKYTYPSPLINKTHDANQLRKFFIRSN